MTTVERKAIHHLIDELSDDQLELLGTFLKYIQSQQSSEPKSEIYAGLHSQHSPQLREQPLQIYEKTVEAPHPFSKPESFAWLAQISGEQQTQFLVELLQATHHGQESHDWSALLDVIAHWQKLAKTQPTFEPVIFPEGLLEGTDFSPEFIAEARKDLWAGFGG